SVHKVDNLGGLSAADSGLWQEYTGWQLEKVGGGGGGSGSGGGGGGGTLGGGGGGEVKVMNTAGSMVDCEPPAPRNLVTFYRGPEGSDGPYATTSLLAPHSLPHHSLKSHQEEHRSTGEGGGEKHSLGHAKTSTERNFYTDGTNTLRRLKGARPMLSAPPLPCLPPPGLPDGRTHTPCYCAGRHIPRAMGESGYSEAHYTPTLSARHACYHARPEHHAHAVCPSHVYASASPLPPYPDSVASSRPSLPSPGTSHHRLCRNSAIYESASLQYAPAGYYLPSSMASSFTSTTSDAPSGVSTTSGMEKVVERGVQSSLPSLTYEALKALGEDIEAFRQMHQLSEEESMKVGVKTSTCGSQVMTSERGVAALAQAPPTFEAPAPPPTPPSSAAQPPATHTAHLPNGPHAGTLAPGGSLPPLEVGVAPLEEAESDCLEEEEGEEEGGDGVCSACSCSCSEAESSVYAETEFTEEVRASLQEADGMGGGVRGRGRRHRHKRRPASTYSTDSNPMQLPHDP
ncbi:uncharacterized protein, partial [Panulirus ornatus]|uniref:uncharacterized protein n=1 Tax=Panulirus ornatus TaxID=150431 RepID=UPI003A885D68